MANGFHIPCSLDGQAGGGAERCPYKACLQKWREGRRLGSRCLLWMVTASPNPLAHTVDGEAPQCPSLRPFPCSLSGLGFLSPGAAARGSLLSQPEPPLHRVTPADAPRLWPEPHPEHRTILWSWSSFLEKSQHQPSSVFLSVGRIGAIPSCVSGTWLSPLGASADGRSCGPCLCGWLLSKSACWEAGELRRNKGALIKPCEVSPCCLRTFLAGYFPFQQEIGSLAETGVLL